MDERLENIYKENPEMIREFAEEIYRKFQTFLSVNEPDMDVINDVITSKSNLAEVVLRVDKRKHYYKVFHGLESISEFKEVALYAFWIIKLKPFNISNPTHKLATSINEYFAVHLILLAIKGCCLQKKKPYMHPCNAFISDVVYSFNFQDLSKEALMLFVDTLAFSYGIYQPEANPGVMLRDSEDE